MMTRQLLRRMMFELIVIAIISVVVLSIGEWMAGNKADDRQQSEYSEEFKNVLPAADYQEVHPSEMELFSDISHVYVAYDEDGVETGYIIDVTVTDKNGKKLHLLEGIKADGAVVTGIRRINDETDPISITDEELDEILKQVMGKRIPIALNSQYSSLTETDDTVIRLGGLHDGTYYAQRQFADRKGYIDYVEIDVIDGIITRVQWDAFNIDPTTPNRREASLTGAYTISGENWATQSYNLCHALINLQDPARLAMKSDGTTEIVEGVTVNIRSFVELANECIDSSRAGYTKTDYYEGMDLAFTRLFGSGAEELGLVNDDGFVVYSFDEYPNYFKVYDNNGNEIGELNIREYVEYYSAGGSDDENGTPIVLDDLPGSDETGTDETYETEEPSAPAQYYDGTEDGVVNGRTNSVITDSIDGIPMAEIITYIEGIDNNEAASLEVLSALNTGYKFLKQYLNWLA